MLNGFEEAFMDAQSSSVSLCMELMEVTNTNFDKVYIYMYTDENAYSFNAFFAKDKKIYDLLNFCDKENALDFLRCGTEDVMNIRKVCKRYKANCPYELKLIYDVKSRGFDADYRYEEFGEDEFPDFRFMEWEEEIKKSLNS